MGVLSVKRDFAKPAVKKLYSKYCQVLTPSHTMPPSFAAKQNSAKMKSAKTTKKHCVAYQDGQRFWVA
jgi:hypothetical protein